MNKKTNKTPISLRDILKRLIGEITTDKKFLAIAILLLVLTVANIYWTFTSIYNLGRKDAKRDLIEIEHIRQAPVTPENHFDFTDPDINDREEDTDTIINMTNRIDKYEQPG